MPKMKAATDSSNYDKTSEINFRFGKNSKLQPTGLDAITMDSEVTVVLKGKITGFSSGEPWDEGKRFSLNMSSCEIMKPPETRPVSMDDALAEASLKRKKMVK